MSARGPTGSRHGGVEDARRALGDRRAVPDVDWVARLTGAEPEKVEEVLAEAAELLPVEREIRSAQLAAGRPGYAQIRAPFELYALVRILRPDHVVETGVSSGVSSAHFLAALRRNGRGRLHSVDRPTFQRGRVLKPGESPVSIPPGRSSGWAIPRRLTRGWDLRVGPSRQLLPRLVRELPSVGIFLHDSLHTPAHLAFELATVRPRLREGSVVLADNTVWTGRAFPDFARQLGVPSLRRRRSDLEGLRYPGSVPPSTPTRRAR
jgi:predicted O-methyltransferase YrrM